MTDLEQRARELIEQWATDYISPGELSINAKNALIIISTDAFNLGAGGAWCAAAQEVRKFAAAAQSSDNNILINFLADQVVGLAPADALAAVERKVSEARLEGANKLSDEIAVVFLAMGVAKLGTTQAIEKIKKLCREATTEWMQHRQAEAAEKEKQG